MANGTSTAGATVPKTPPHGIDSGSELKSTLLAVGSAAVSEHISTLTLFADCLKAVLLICNKGKDAQAIKKNLGDLVKSRVEDQMYKPFIQASNLALDRLSKLNAPGLVCSKGHDNHKILFHQNDPKNITQKHQGKKSMCKPDIIIISHTGTKKVQKQPGQAYKYKEALEKPTKQFQWTDIRSMVEFKHKKIWAGLSKPPATYAAKAYNVPEAKKYMKYHREMNNTAEPMGLMPLPGSSAAMSLCQTSDAFWVTEQQETWL
ncbi:uncharacterized protein BJ212DRAFT_1500164 [Suillus subaureus]|uniref:Uncharacterized protein n=1 Tax=Suillus subaureus TaxID=48587 RepID=A0A9P7EDF6_9AGAM|nr:uncharacterized protein BJ212DRAFT_1500164 [Suillus subaureus]KAG1817638.1 hypothetical protein BJ212DRAFT_1500164 [Suillus subaureus]